MRQARPLSRHPLQRRRRRGACHQYGLQARDAVQRKRTDDDLRQDAGRTDAERFRRQGVTFFSLAPLLRGEGWGEGLLSSRCSDSIWHGASAPPPIAPGKPTPPPKERGGGETPPSPTRPPITPPP